MIKLMMEYHSGDSTVLRTLLYLNGISSESMWSFVSNAVLAYEDFMKHMHILYHAEEVVDAIRATPNICEKIIDLDESLHEELAKYDFTQSIKDQIISQAQRKTINTINNLMFDEKNEHGYALPIEVAREMWPRVNAISTDAHTLTTVFKTLYEAGELDIKEASGVSFETIRGGEIPEQLIAEMREMLVSNYKKFYSPKLGEDGSEEFINPILKGLDEAVTNENSKFYVLSRNDKLIGFCRFDELEDGGGHKYLYGGSFNVDRMFGGGKIGEAMFAEIIKQEGERGVPIHATCNPEMPVSQEYMERGFAAEWFVNLNDVPYFRITFDSKRNGELSTRSATKEHIKERAKAGEYGYHFSHNKPTTDDLAKLNEGALLTRYFEDKEEGVWYWTLEDLINEEKILHPSEATLIREESSMSIAA